jgi:Leucine-rich repeat (LRR) protein
MATIEKNNLELTNDFFKSKENTNMYTCEILFLNNNKITKLNLEKFTNLIILDISNNPLSELTNIPDTLEELVCHDCQIKILPPAKNIKRLICFNNKLSNIPYYDTIETIDCSDNKILSIDNVYPQLKTLVCCNNPIVNICLQPNLETLDCVSVDIDSIIFFPKLKNLSISNTNNILLPDTYKITSCIQTDNIIDIQFI